MDKIKQLEREINYIKNDKYKENLKILIELLPDYFFEVAASSTGKYHPKYALGNGGLLRHTKAAAIIANELLNNNTIGSAFTQNEKDLMIVALILHDGLKLGETKEKYTKFDHPILMANFIRKNKDKLTLDEKEIEFIATNIETHMGEWTQDYNGNEVLSKPKNKYQKFVHMCDFLASRKFLEVPFEKNNIFEEII